MNTSISKFQAQDITKYLYFYLLNLKHIYLFNSRLKSDLNQKEVVFVYQMGKVGSTSIEESLIELTKTTATPFYRCHYLNPQTVNRLLKQKIKIHQSLIKRHYLTSKYLSKKLFDRGLGESNWKIITLVRDPININISRFFESIQDFVPDFYTRFGNLTDFYQKIDRGLIDIQEIIKFFFDSFPYHDWALNWFDLEMKSVFNIDVFSKNFPQEQGYQIINKNNVDLLILKLELINKNSKHAFNEFMGIENFTVKNANVAKDKIYKNAYQKFKESIVFPDEYLEKIYNHKYTRHFYNGVEIENSIKRWS